MTEPAASRAHFGTLLASRTRAVQGRTGAGRLVLAGAGLGLTWSCGLRGWMIALAGPESTVSWAGTLGGVLAPGALVGGLLGWAEWRRRAGLPRSGWLIASPGLLALAPLAVPGVLASLLRTGEGSGALGMVSLAMLGGYSMSGTGSLRSRAVAGLVGFAVVPALWLAPPMAPHLAPSTPYGALFTLTFSTLFAALAAACSIPMRAHEPAEEQTPAPVARRA